MKQSAQGCSLLATLVRPAFRGMADIFVACRMLPGMPRLRVTTCAVAQVFLEADGAACAPWMQRVVWCKGVSRGMKRFSYTRYKQTRNRSLSWEVCTQ